MRFLSFRRVRNVLLALLLGGIVFQLIGAVIRDFGPPSLHAIGDSIHTTATNGVVDIIFAIIFLMIIYVFYRRYQEWEESNDPTKGAQPAGLRGEKNGYNEGSGFSYTCENCGRKLHDDLDINAAGSSYTCGHCGSELNNQDGASDTHAFG